MYQYERLSGRHKHIMDLVLDGMTRTEIAQDLKMSPEGVGNILNSDLFQHQISQRRDEMNGKVDEQRILERVSADEILSRHASQAAQKQVDFMTKGSEKVQQVACMDILDRSGFPKVTKQHSQNTSVNINVSSELIERMNKASMDSFGEPMKFKPELIE